MGSAATGNQTKWKEVERKKGRKFQSAFQLLKSWGMGQLNVNLWTFEGKKSLFQKKS